MFQIQNTPQTQAADAPKPKQAEQKETTAQEFQNTIFQQFGDKVSAGVISQIYNNNDTNHSGGLDGTEKAKAMADVNAYITSTINSAASDNQPNLAQMKKDFDEGVQAFQKMTPEQQKASIESDLKQLFPDGVPEGSKITDLFDLEAQGVPQDVINQLQQYLDEYIQNQNQ